MRRFSMGPPAFDIRDVPTTSEQVGVDVLRCPAADYIRARDLGELCAQTWCALDFELAERRGAQLKRSSTLAEGGERCDFRFLIGSP
ncbi:MAG: L-2-amino-thiazoline-4-carboxylic acid hydrolase [Alphaproteobacteria bacterium]|nr:L-2-amino-thiazoline-4-carboxylic acid hydrolase [Alphaproteobacteria bacterium]